MAELKSAVAMAPSRRFGTLAEDLRVTRTAAALEANGISVVRAANAAEAKQVVLGLIPDGCQVHQGASLSLEAAGITDEIERSGRYEPLRPRIGSMDRETQGDDIRRVSSSPDGCSAACTRSPRPDRWSRLRQVAASWGPTPRVPGKSSSWQGHRRSCPT